MKANDISTGTRVQRKQTKEETKEIKQKGTLVTVNKKQILGRKQIIKNKARKKKSKYFEEEKRIEKSEKAIKLKSFETLSRMH